MENMATGFFKELYTTDGGVNHEPLTELFDATIAEEMNGDICKEFIDKEISDAVF
jgi:hypothetical protein